MGRALVLGGGGVTGVAWELGILAGLAEAGVDVTDADLIVGTSAGSAVAAQVAGAQRLADLYQRQLAGPGAEVAAQLRLSTVARMAFASLRTRDGKRARAYIGAMALAANTIGEDERRKVIASRLSSDQWPDARLLITAVVADSGEFVVFDRESGVSLVDAVGASCAVPGVWPPVTINGLRYIDGGMRSPANVDLAAGCDRIVVIAPIAGSFRRRYSAAAQLSALAPARGLLIAPDQLARKAIGRNVLDPARRAPSAEAGRRQALELAPAVRRVWSD